MLAKSPVVEGLEPYEIVLGGNQPEYLPLPVLRSAGPSYAVMSRWVLTEEERQMIVDGGDIYLTLWTFGRVYPPTMLHVMRSDADVESIKDWLELDTELDSRLGAQFAAELLKQKTAPEAKQNDKA